MIQLLLSKPNASTRYLKTFLLLHRLKRISQTRKMSISAYRAKYSSQGGYGINIRTPFLLNQKSDLFRYSPHTTSVLGCFCLASKKLPGSYPTQSKTVVRRSRGSRVAWLAEPRWLPCLQGRPRQRPLPGPTNHPQLAARALPSTLQAPPAAASLELREQATPVSCCRVTDT